MIIIDKPTREESLSQPLQTINEQFKIAVTFLSGHNGIFKVTNKQIKFIFLSVFGRAEHNIIKSPAGAYEMESLNAANKRNIFEEGYVTEEDCSLIENSVNWVLLWKLDLVDDGKFALFRAIL